MIEKMISELTKLEKLEEIANHAEDDYDKEPGAIPGGGFLLKMKGGFFT